MSRKKAAAGSGRNANRYLCSALASCIGITLRMYADRKEWKTGAITVDVELDRSGDKPVFSIGLRFANTLPEDQLQRLQLIAGKCRCISYCTATMNSDTSKPGTPRSYYQFLTGVSADPCGLAVFCGSFARPPGQYSQPLDSGLQIPACPG